MKQVRAFHPLLFAAFPNLAVFSANAALFSATQIIRPLLLSIGLAMAVWIVIGIIVRDWNRSAISTSALILCFFSYDWLFGWMVEDEFAPQVLIGWAVFSITIAAFASWKFRWHRFANVISVSLCIVSVGFIAYSSMRKLSFLPRDSITRAAADVPMPDILYIILDGYGRTDQLERAIGYSDRWFIDELSKRGFYIASQSHSNYSQTDLSLVSTLNMETVQDLFPNADPESSDRLPLFQLIDNNRVATELRQLGYIYVGVPSGYPGIKFETADYVPQSGQFTTLFEATILQLTPLRLSSKTVGSLYDSRRADLLRAIRHLQELSAATASPRFIVAHIMAPHPPFVLTADGQPVRPRGPFGFFDGSHYMQLIGTEMDYRLGYADQARFIAKKMLAVIDEFLSKATVRPIIVIQGDHGSKVHLDQESLENTDVQECFGIINALLVPEDMRRGLYPEITSINTFRWLLSNLFHLDFPLLPDRSYYSTISKPFELTEVTEKLKPPEPRKPTLVSTGRYDSISLNLEAQSRQLR